MVNENAEKLLAQYRLTVNIGLRYEFRGLDSFRVLHAMTMSSE